MELWLRHTDLVRQPCISRRKTAYSPSLSATVTTDLHTMPKCQKCGPGPLTICCFLCCSPCICCYRLIYKNLVRKRHKKSQDLAPRAEPAVYNYDDFRVPACPSFPPFPTFVSQAYEKPSDLLPHFRGERWPAMRPEFEQLYTERIQELENMKNMPPIESGSYDSPKEQEHSRVMRLFDTSGRTKRARMYPQSKSYFLTRLPAEIRLLIYDFVLREPGSLHIRPVAYLWSRFRPFLVGSHPCADAENKFPSDGHSDCIRAKRERKRLSLLTTCRRV